jgi:xylulokinase
MLCGLNAGLEALLEARVFCERIFLVGGAARNVAVQRIAGEIFGVPVIVPEPGEYVANGAAAQAAHALTGELPGWVPQIIATISVPRVAEISAQYSRAANRIQLASAGN